MSEVQIHYENMVKSKLQALWFEVRTLSQLDKNNVLTYSIANILLDGNGQD